MNSFECAIAAWSIEWEGSILLNMAIKHSKKHNESDAYAIVPRVVCKSRLSKDVSCTPYSEEELEYCNSVMSLNRREVKKEVV